MIIEIIMCIYGWIGLLLCTVFSIIARKWLSKMLTDEMDTNLDLAFVITMYIFLYITLWPLILTYMIIKGIRK